MSTASFDTRIIEGDTPAQRLLALLEVIAEKDQYFTLQSLVDETGLPKPTLHRMLQQLETELLPEVRQGEFTIEVALPVGTPLEETERILAPVERALLEEVERSQDESEEATSGS